MTKRMFSISIPGVHARLEVTAEIHGETVDDTEIANLAHQASIKALMKAKAMPGPRPEPQSLERFIE